MKKVLIAALIALLPAYATAVEMRLATPAQTPSNTTQDYTVSSFGTPDAAIIFTDGNACTADSSQDGINQSYSFFDGTNYAGVYANIVDNDDPDGNISISEVYDNNTVETTDDFGNTFRTAATPTWITDGLRLTWNTDSGGFDPCVSVILIKGSGTESFIVGSATASTTNNGTVTPTTTGVDPNAILMASIGAPGATLDSADFVGRITQGFAVDDSGISQHGFGYNLTWDATGAVDANHALASDMALIGVDNQLGSTTEYEVTAMGAEDFTVTTRQGTQGDDYSMDFVFLAMELDTAPTLFMADMPTTSGDYDPFTASAEPDSVLAFLTGHTTDDSEQQSGVAVENTGWYYANENEDRGVAMWNDDNVDPSNTTTRHSDNFIFGGTGGTPDIQGSAPTFDASGIVFSDANITDATAAYRWFGLAFYGASGDSTAPTCSAGPTQHSVSDTSVIVDATCSDETDSTVNHYWNVTADGQTDPTTTELRTDTYGGTELDYEADTGVSNAAESQVTLTGLTAETAYDVFHTVCDSSNNCKTVVQTDITTTASGPAVTADDSTPIPGQTITVTASPVFTGAMTTLTCNTSTISAEAGATTSSADFAIWALTEFVAGGDAEDVDPDSAINCTVTDGTDSPTLSLTFDFANNESGTTWQIATLGVTIDSSEGIACSASEQNDLVRADRVSGTLLDLATNAILTGTTESYSVNSYCWDVSASAWVDNAGNPLAFGDDPGDVTAPTLSSATINANGEDWSIVFDEPVTFSGATTGFSGDCSEGGSVPLAYSSGDSSNTLVYAGDTVILEDDTCTLDYSPGTVEDEASNALASFSDESVTNDSSETLSPPGDTTAPTCSLPLATTDISDVAVTVDATCQDETDVGVIHYFAALADGSTDPTPVEMVSNSYSGGFIDRDVRGELNGARAEARLSGMAASTDYDLFHTVCDYTENCTSVVQLNATTLDSTPFSEEDEETLRLRNCGDGTYRTVCP